MKCKKKKRNEICDTIYFVHISIPHVQCGFFFSVKCQNSMQEVMQCYYAKCVSIYVWMPTKIYLYTYYYIPFLNDQSFHHWQKLCKSNWWAKSVSKSNVGHRRFNPFTCYCLALNGRTILIKAHSIDNNTSMFISIIY
jgi:hypothetical protein